MFRRVSPCVRFVEERRVCVPDQLVCEVLGVCHDLLATARFVMSAEIRSTDLRSDL